MSTNDRPAFKVADLSLAEFGRNELRLAEQEMPGLMALRERYAGTQPLRGAKILGSLHMTIQTGVLIETLAEPDMYKLTRNQIDPIVKAIRTQIENIETKTPSDTPGTCSRIYMGCRKTNSWLLSTRLMMMRITSGMSRLEFQLKG